MAEKPTYEELEQRVRELKREAAERKREQESIWESEEKYRSLVESTEDSIYLIDKNYRYLFMNNKHLSRFGLPKEEVIGRTYSAFHSEEETKEFSSKVQAVFESGQSLWYEYSSRRDGGYFLRTLSPVKGSDGRTTAVTVVSKNITERKRAEEALREGEEKYRLVIENANDAILVAQDGMLKFGNPKAREMTGYTNDELTSRPFVEFIHPDDREMVFERHLKRLEGEKIPGVYAFRFIDKHGNIGWVEISAALTTWEGRPATLNFLKDISERKQAEQHIRTLTQELIRAQESERQKISHELHDRVAQDLSTAKIACETLFDDPGAVSSSIQQKISELSRTLQGSITAVRDLSYDLRPPSLDQLGLVRTVFEYCEDFAEKNDISVDFYSAGINDLHLDFDIEINLYRLIQEGLNNIRKHADASHVTIRLVASFPNIILRIEDDGKGFEVKERLARALYGKHMGLSGMEERVSLLQGKMGIESRPMQGTKILIEVPCKEKENGSEEMHIDR
jgi:PAS domain S-box-containing protein